MSLSQRLPSCTLPHPLVVSDVRPRVEDGAHAVTHKHLDHAVAVLVSNCLRQGPSQKAWLSASQQARQRAAPRRAGAVQQALRTNARGVATAADLPPLPPRQPPPEWCAQSP